MLKIEGPLEKTLLACFGGLKTCLRNIVPISPSGLSWTGVYKYINIKTPKILVLLMCTNLICIHYTTTINKINQHETYFFNYTTTVNL